jgi:hypothetical protein
MNEISYLKNAKTLLDTPMAYAAYVAEKKTLFCVIKQAYIRKEDFENLFNLMGDEAKREGAEKIIFDKRNMKVFDQPSMTWYHIVFKEDLLATIALKKYRKLLPPDELFKMSVEIGKGKIAREHHFDFSKYDIQYCETIEEAFEK